MSKPWTKERLESIRKMRKARRLFKQQPLFAYYTMREEYNDYGYDDFLNDLRYRTPSKRKKGKSNRNRYGRYSRMMQVWECYKRTGNMEEGLKVQQLNKHMTKPYRVMVKIDKQRIEYGFSPLIPIASIEELVIKLAQCQTESEADAIVQAFRKTAHIN